MRFPIPDVWAEPTVALPAAAAASTTAACTASNRELTSNSKLRSERRAEFANRILSMFALVEVSDGGSQ